jgi:hypothetical protein
MALPEASNPLSSYFWQNDPNVNMELRKRIALQMMASGSKFPKTIGEGLSAIGDALGDRRIANELSQQDLALQGLNPPAGGTAPQSYADVHIQDEPGVKAITAASGPSISPVAPSAIAQQPASLGPIPQTDTRGLVGGQASDQSQPNELDANIDPTFGRRRAVAGIESGGARDPYATLGATTPSGDRAYGKYQVMGANIGPWTKDALGRSLTPQQFLADRDAQDKTFDNQFGGYANKYGEEGAAKAWYAGEGGMNNPNATDQHGRLTVAGYGQDYLNRLNGGDPRNAITSAVMARGTGQPQPSPALAFAGTGSAGGPDTPPAQPAPVQVAQAQLHPRNPQRTVTDIQPAPQQQYPAGYVPPAAEKPQGAPVIQPTPREVELSTWAAQQTARGNPYAAAKVAAELGPLQKAREIRQAEANKWYEAQIAKGNVQDTQRVEAQRGQAKAVQDYQKASQDLITGTAGVPSSGILQGGGTPYVPGSYANTPRNFDPRLLGTDASPQRTGIPTPEPIQPGVTPAAHAADQQKKMSAINDAVDKGTQQLQQSLELIKLAKTHPGREWGLGGTGGYLRDSPWAGDAYAFGAINKQIKGKNFMAGYQDLRGAGAIGQKEGEKAEEAQANIDPNMKKEHYDAALQRLEDTLRGNVEMAQRKANRPVTAWSNSPNDPPAPDIGQPGVRNGKSVVYAGGDPSKDASYREVGR